MALSANKTYDINPLGTPGSVLNLPVKASAVAYQGSAAGYSSGTVRALVAQDDFAGFFREPATGGASDGTVSAFVITEGLIRLPTIAGADGLDDINKAVYMSDDGTFTLTSTNNSAIGKTVAYDATNGWTVRFQGTPQRSI